LTKTIIVTQILNLHKGPFFGAPCTYMPENGSAIAILTTRDKVTNGCLQCRDKNYLKWSDLTGSVWFSSVQLWQVNRP